MDNLSSFKAMVASDIENTFLNMEEFAEKHIIEGREITVIIAPDQNLPVGSGFTLGVGESSIVIQAKTQDLPPMLMPGASISVDGREYIVDKWNEHMGMSEIQLSQTRTGG